VDCSVPRMSWNPDQHPVQSSDYSHCWPQRINQRMVRRQRGLITGPSACRDTITKNNLYYGSRSSSRDLGQVHESCGHVGGCIKITPVGAVSSPRLEGVAQPGSSSSHTIFAQKRSLARFSRTERREFNIAHGARKVNVAAGSAALRELLAKERRIYARRHRSMSSRTSPSSDGMTLALTSPHSGHERGSLCRQVKVPVVCAVGMPPGASWPAAFAMNDGEVRRAGDAPRRPRQRVLGRRSRSRR